MEDRSLSFVSTHHPSDGALVAAITGCGGSSGGMMPLLLPSSPLRDPPGISNACSWSSSATRDRDASRNAALSLSTYTAGEDAGRLAMMAKEFGLARTRRSKRQLRKHAFKAFLRNHPSDLNEEIPQCLTHAEDESRCDHLPQSPEVTTETPSTSVAVAPAPSFPSLQRHPPLRFVFSGYSLWLELEQTDIDDDGRGDLDRAMIDAADRFRLGGAIPSPHVTALYGIETVADEEEVRRTFRENVRRVLLEEAERRGDEDVGKLWPDLAATGIVVDVEFDGVNGGTMDMAWAEVSLATSPEHEALIDALHELFYRRPAFSSSPSSGEEKKEEYAPRSEPWVPHLSLCYDNPEGLGPNLTRSSVEDLMREKCPTLKCVLDDDVDGDGSEDFTRAVRGISLWRTAGTMAEWECLDRFEFPSGGTT